MAIVEQIALVGWIKGSPFLDMHLMKNRVQKRFRSNAIMDPLRGFAYRSFIILLNTTKQLGDVAYMCNKVMVRNKWRRLLVHIFKAKKML